MAVAKLQTKLTELEVCALCRDADPRRVGRDYIPRVPGDRAS